MATIVNTPPAQERDSGMGFLLGVILLLAVFFLFFVYGLPILRNSVGSSVPSINVPGQIDVNVKQQK